MVATDEMDWSTTVDQSGPKTKAKPIAVGRVLAVNDRRAEWQDLELNAIV